MKSWRKKKHKMLFTISFQHKHTWVRGEDFILLSCTCSSKLMLQLHSVCKLKRINGYKNIKAHSCTRNFDPVAKLWLKAGAHTKYALISPYIWFREKMGFVFIISFFYPRALDLKEFDPWICYKFPNFWKGNRFWR